MEGGDPSVVAAIAARPPRAADPWTLAEFYQLPEPPAEPARLPGWLAQVRRAGYCAHPVRLAGRVDQGDIATGEVRQVFATDAEPGGVLLKACGNRRASVCPACAETYRRDAWQLIAAGLRGGKGTPETIGEHPRLFVTFTAPSFGAVHTQRRNRRGELLPCRPRDLDKRCAHGRKVGCWKRHGDGERCLGEPVCPGCFDYQAQVLWNALAPELWRRTTEYVKRSLAHLSGISRRGLDRVVRVSFCKVAEYQARGAVHFHAVIRLDAASLEDDSGTPAPPPPWFTAELLAEAVKLAAARVAVPVPELVEDQAVTLVVRWGRQLDVRPIAQAGPGELSAEAVAGYVAKYATKSTESLGAALNRRITDAVELDALPVRPHVAKLVRTAWELGGNPCLKALRLRRWAHQLGFGGHWSTKRRRYSTTFTALRRARIAHTLARRHGTTQPLDLWGRAASEEASVVLSAWEYRGRGYRIPQGARLAVASAVRARARTA
jgi:hypothetical protein